MPPASPLEFSSLLRTYRYPLRITPLLRTQTSISRTIHRRSFNSSSSNSNSSSTHNHSSSSNQASNSTLKAQHTAFDSPDQSLADRTSSPESTTASAKSLPNMSSKLIPANPADVMVIRDVTPNITTFSVPFLRFGTIKVGGRGTLVRLSTGTLAIFSPVALTDDADLFFNLPATEQYSRVPDAQKAPGLADRLFGSLQTTEGDGKWARRVQWHLFSAKDRTGYSESVRRIAEWDFETVIPCHGDTMVGDGKERFLKVFAWHLNGEKKL
ncbi:hypothetical protein BN1723_003421 [Verticillium longisporum]|uniref:Uncharacterized protein n=1 Tax=Verticillium longisporum TaxID=100787 RepID=A0A0G4LYU2_VERLO|nr:hypothetical protein BN1723_003421 [Verticillium longisporum]